MTDFTLTENSFIIDGREQPFLCGEIHYFRMPKHNWSKALDLLAESGCNAVAFYIPWFVHEYSEGKFDFHGEFHESNDLHTWLRLTREKGLMAFCRPGPYIYAETTNLGIPVWFTEKYPNANVKAYKNGKYESYGFVPNGAHNHPDFIRAVKRWYEAVCREIRDYQAPNGNIVLFQLCNEIPNEDIDDRNPENLGIGKPDGLYPSFLKERYGSLDMLNKRYHADFISFEYIEPHMLEERNKEQYFEDHLAFYYEYYYPEYFRKLAVIARDNGITVPLVHNAYNPRAISLHYHNKRKNPWLIVGVDCYYSLAGRLGIKELVYFCEFGAEYSRAFLKNVPWVMEQECGYWHDYPAVYGPELYIWNIWTMAAGYKGINMYLFASGENRPGMGFYGTDHNWQAPVDVNGEKNAHFDDIKRSLQDIKDNIDVFLDENRYDIAMGIKNSPGLIWRNISKISSEAYFALRSTGFMPEIRDFEAESLEELKELPALWIVSDSVMEEHVQRKLCDYVKGGGKLILQGAVPYLHETGQPCTLLADELGIKVCPHKDEDCPQQKIVLDGKEYYIGRTVQKFETDPEFIAARAWEGQDPAAAVMPYGKGTVLVLPFRIDMKFYSMTECIRKLLDRIAVKPFVEGNRLLGVIPKKSSRNIILNYHPVEVREMVKLDGRPYDIALAPHSFMIV
ncbi:MAG TPA: hypothetical protein GX505_12120 [Clostridiales bacterium]|nr:hypothetical protein [Clostridiales bacterium]